MAHILRNLRKVNKLGELTATWVEQATLTILILGIAASYSSQTKIILTTLTGGAILGRILYRWKRTFKIPIYIIATGFLIGYYFGAFLNYIILSTTFFTIGFFGSYLLHNKKIIESVEY